MPRGIIIFGSAGSGKTTLGRLLAQRLAFPYVDIDDYIWRKDAPLPFTKMYTRDEKISGLTQAISLAQNFVMAGSMSSFHAAFDPLFDLAVLLRTDTDVRLQRIKQREYDRYGARVLPGGDLYENSQSFLEDAARYDTDGSPNLTSHLQWASEMTCPVLYMDGALALDENCTSIMESYANLKSL